jgi:hypothetical protein
VRFTLVALAFLVLPAMGLCKPKISTKRVTADQLIRLTLDKNVEIVVSDGSLIRGSVQSGTESELVLTLDPEQVVKIVPANTVTEVRLGRKVPCRDGIAAGLGIIGGILATVAGVAAQNDGVAKWGLAAGVPIYLGVCAASKGEPYFSKVYIVK